MVAFLVLLLVAQHVSCFQPISVTKASLQSSRYRVGLGRKSLSQSTTSIRMVETSSRTWKQKKPDAPSSGEEHNQQGQTQNRSNAAASLRPPFFRRTIRQQKNQDVVESKDDKIIVKRRRREKMKPMPVRGYDAGAIEEYYDLRPTAVIWRLNSLGLPLLGWYHKILIDRALKRQYDIEIQRERGSDLRELLVNSRSVALIKSGQALSLRPDLLRNPYWAEELGKLVDAVGAFPDKEAMNIMRTELGDLEQRINDARGLWEGQAAARLKKKGMSRLQKKVESDPILSLFEFYNNCEAVASASVGQVYKARIRSGPQLEAAIGAVEASKWGDKVVAIKVQRPDVVASASLDMYLLRRTASWLSKVRGGDLPKIADAFGMQLFGELDYIREANNCERFRELYGYWEDIKVPAACAPFTRQRVLVMEWVDGEKGPWEGDGALEMVSIGLRCSVDQLMTTGLFHADPHRGNLLKTPDGKLGLIDFGSVVDIDEDFRYSLFGLVIGLQNRDMSLVTENLLKLGFLKDTEQLDILIPRLRRALKNATGGTGKARDVNFSRLQAELDEISRENILRFSTPPFFTVILRSLTILEGVALSVDENFRLVRGAYPYVLNQLLSGGEDGEQPKALQKLLVRLLTVDGKGQEIKWETLRDFLRLAQKAQKRYDPSDEEEDEGEDKATISRTTLEMFAKFLSSGAGIFLKKPLVHELAETIDGMASIGEGTLIRASRGLIPALPGMNGPVNTRRMDEVSMLIETFQDALISRDSREGMSNIARLQAMMEVLRELGEYVRDSRQRDEAGPLLDEVQSVIQLVALEVLEIRGSRAMRSILRLQPS